MTRSFWSRALRRLVFGPSARTTRVRPFACEVLEDRSVPATLNTFLTAEHVDLSIGYTGGAAGTWSLGAFDDDNSILYSAEDALLYVGTPALASRLSSSAFDFVGVGGGAQFYQLPQNQDPDVLYLGVEADVTPSDFDRYNPSTESKGRVSGLGRWVKATLVDVDHFNPDGTAGTGVFSVWQDTPDGPRVFISSFNDGVANPNTDGLDTTDGISADDAIWVLAGGHNHYNYGFSQPGRYEVTFRLSGYQDDGNTTELGQFIQSGDLKVYFSVNSVGQVSFDTSSYTVNEGDGTATITVNRTGGSDGRITVNYATSDGTATAGSDYIATSGTLTFNDGETTKTFTVAITDDTDVESNETINLTLSSAGPASINTYLIDHQGDANGLLGTTTTATLTIFDNDEPPGDDPTISDVLDQTIDEDDSVMVNFTVGDTETPAGDLNVTATSSNTTLVPKGNLVLGGSGADRTLTITPAANQFGTTTITLTVTDGAGQTATDTFVLTVNPVNDAPVANPQSVTLNEDTPTIITLIGTDVDGDPLSFVIVTGPTNGTLTGTGASRTYTPNANFNGSDSFTFLVNDGTDDSNVATVSITVNAVNDAPVAAPDSYVVSPGNVVRGNVLFNDTDVEGDPLTAVLGTGPTFGTLVLNPNGTFTYTPGTGFAGTDSFTYRASDGSAQSALTTVSITAAGFQDFQAVPTTEHVDIGVAYEDDAWDLHVHNEDADEEYEPDGVLLAVVPEALTKRSGGFAGAEFDFLGVAVGESFYLLPQSPNPEVLLLGIGGEEIEAGTFQGGQVELRLLAVNGPGHFSAWLNTAGGPDVRFATSDGITAADVTTVLEGGHQEYNFGFSARGRYEVTFEASGTLTDGTPTSSGPVTYYISVDNLGQVQFSSATYSVTEGGTVTVTVTRTAGSDGPLTVDYATTDGTATAGSDYTAASGTLTFNDGETTKTFAVTTAADTTVEGDETVNLVLTAPADSTTALGTPATAVLTISDPPVAPPSGIPTGIIAGAGVGGQGATTVFNLDGSTRLGVIAFPGYTGAVTVARGDVNGDGVDDLIVGTLTGADHVKVFDGQSGALLQSFLAFGGFSGGVNVGSGDLDGDGRADILVSVASGAPGGHVMAFSGATGAVIRSFFAFEGFNGSVTVAGGDVNSDGRADIIVGTGGGFSHVKVFDGAAGTLLSSFFAFEGFNNGISVGAADLDGNGSAEILVGTLAGASHVKAFNRAGQLMSSFIAFPGSLAGVSVAGTDRGIAVGVAGLGTTHVKEFDQAGNVLVSLFAFADFLGGIEVG